MSNESDEAIKAYYKVRAPVYDRVYEYPERQSNLRYLENYVSQQFSGREVIEVAAGTGYWTQFISRSARHILATDTTADALAQTALRDIRCALQAQVVDAYSLDALDQRFDGAFAGLWFSHIPVERRKDWLNVLHGCLETGATVLLLDNSIAQCSRLPITHTDAQGNTYQDRETDDGEVYRVRKNFPTELELLELTTPLGGDHQYQELDHFWLFQYVAG